MLSNSYMEVDSARMEGGTRPAIAIRPSNSIGRSNCVTPSNITQDECTWLGVRLKVTRSTEHKPYLILKP